MNPSQIINKTDDELRVWTLSGDAGSNAHLLGAAEMNMRVSLRVAEAAAQMATANRDLVETTKQVLQAHHEIRDKTRNLVFATWGLVVVTLLLVLSEFIRR